MGLVAEAAWSATPSASSAGFLLPVPSEAALVGAQKEEASCSGPVTGVPSFTAGDTRAWCGFSSDCSGNRGSYRVPVTMKVLGECTVWPWQGGVEGP